MIDEEIEECGKCGAKGELRQCDNPHHKNENVICLGCGTRGAAAEIGNGDAIRFWNRRMIKLREITG